MHKYERIAIWVFIALIIVYMFVTNRASMYANPGSIFNLREFDDIPRDVGNAMSGAVRKFSKLSYDQMLLGARNNKAEMVKILNSATVPELLYMFSGSDREYEPEIKSAPTDPPRLRMNPTARMR
jgi:hypothetical protein